MADLLPDAAARHGRRAAVRQKREGEWRDVSHADLRLRVDELALGLIALGIEPGDRVAILSHTRPEWTQANLAILAAGAASVSVYQTNSAEECRYVLAHSGSRAVFVEDREQLTKLETVREELPELEHAIIFEPAGRAGAAISLGELSERGGSLDPGELARRTAAIAPGDSAILIYTSGTTGPPKGCVLTHRNFRDVADMAETQGIVAEGDVVYLFLPLAHAFALLVQFIALDVGATIAYWGKDPEQLVAELQETRPTYFPSVPRIFEKIHALATSAAPDPERLRKAVEVGLEVRQLERGGEQVPAGLRAAFDAAEQALFANVRAIFGGRIRLAITGSAPIDPEILEFFHACGVPVMEGYGLTETSTVATVNSIDDFRLGSVGKPLPRQELRIADDGEILLKGPNIFKEYFRNEEATTEALVDGWFHTGDLGRIDEDGFVYVRGRKKDIIITAGGKNVTPANLESGLKRSRWISHAVVIGDRRPYLVALIALDPEEAERFAAEHGLSAGELPGSREMRAAVQEQVDRVNSEVGPVEQIKRFEILPRDLSQESGELTPSLKVKRKVVQERHAELVDDLYAGEAGGA